MFNHGASSITVAIGMAIGLFWGLSPFLAPHNIAWLLLILIFRIPLNAALVGMGIAIPFSFGFATQIDALGEYILTLPTLKDLWTGWFNSFMVLTKFNNTFIMGSFVIAAVLFIPAIFLFKFLVRKYRDFMRKNFFETAFYKKFLVKTKIFDFYFKVSDEVKKDENLRKKKKFLFAIFDWKFAVPLVLIIAGVVIAVKYYLDDTVRDLITQEATEYNQAKVDVGAFRTSFFNQSANVYSFAWTDNKNYMQNLFSFEQFSARANLLPLLRGSFVFDELAIINIGLNTPRKISGELSKQEGSALPPAGDNNANHQSGDDTSLSASKSSGANGQIPTDKTTELKKQFEQTLNESIANSKANLQKEQNRIIKENQDIVNRYEGKINTLRNDLNLSKEIKTLQAININAIKDLPSALQVASQIGGVANAAKKADQAKNVVSSLQRDFDNDFKRIQSTLNPDNIQKSILDIVLKSVGVEAISLDHFSEKIFGPVISKQVDGIITQYKKYKYLLVKNTDAGEKKTSVTIDDLQYDHAKRLGRAISFPLDTNYPTVFAKKLLGTGDTTRNGVHEINIENLSSDPRFAPIKNTIRLQQQGITASITGSFFMPNQNNLDVVQQIQTEPFELMDVLTVAPNPILDYVKKGRASVLAQITDKNQIIKLVLRLTGQDLGFEINQGLPSQFKEAVNAAVANIPLLDIKVSYQERPNRKPVVNINSNLDQILKRKISEVFNRVIREQQAYAEREIRRQLGPEITKLQGTLKLNPKSNVFDGIAKEINAYTQNVDKLQNKIKELENQQKQEAIKKVVDQVQKQIKIPGFK